MENNQTKCRHRYYSLFISPTSTRKCVKCGELEIGQDAWSKGFKAGYECAMSEQKPVLPTVLIDYDTLSTRALRVMTFFHVRTVQDLCEIDMKKMDYEGIGPTTRKELKELAKRHGIRIHNL